MADIARALLTRKCNSEEEEGGGAAKTIKEEREELKVRNMQATSDMARIPAELHGSAAHPKDDD